MAVDAATMLFNLPDYRVVSTTLTADGCRQVIVESEQPPGCLSCGVVATRRKERRFQRIRDIPIAGRIEVPWRKYRWYCQESECGRLSFFESTSQVPARARSKGRLRDHLVDAVIRSGRAMSETAAGFAVSWRMVRAAVNEAFLLTFPDVDALRPRLLGIDEHRFRSVRYFKDPDTKVWHRFEPWMTTTELSQKPDVRTILKLLGMRSLNGPKVWNGRRLARPAEVTAAPPPDLVHRHFLDKYWADP